MHHRCASNTPASPQINAAGSHLPTRPKRSGGTFSAPAPLTDAKNSLLQVDQANGWDKRPCRQERTLRHLSSQRTKEEAPGGHQGLLLRMIDLLTGRRRVQGDAARGLLILLGFVGLAGGHGLVSPFVETREVGFVCGLIARSPDRPYGGRAGSDKTWHRHSQGEAQSPLAIP